MAKEKTDRELMIERVDKLYRDPTERAEAVWEFLQRAWQEKNGERPIPMWDIVMFANEIIGQMALGSEEPDFLALAKAMSRQIYTMHYNYPEVLHGKPDKKGNDDEIPQ